MGLLAYLTDRLGVVAVSVEIVKTCSE